MFDFVELLGYAAAGMTMVTYAMRTMIPLRVAAILANVLFLSYSILAKIYPSILLHAVLLPFNIYRLAELYRLSRAAKIARKTPSMGHLSLFRHIGKRETRPGGTYLFRKGDAPDNVYFIEAGEITLDELGITLGQSEVVGEMAFFTDAERRSASARCVGDVTVRRIDDAAFMRVYFQSPAFALAIQKLITRRLMERTSPPLNRAAATSAATDAGVA